VSVASSVQSARDELERTTRSMATAQVVVVCRVQHDRCEWRKGFASGNELEPIHHLSVAVARPSPVAKSMEIFRLINALRRDFACGRHSSACARPLVQTAPTWRVPSSSSERKRPDEEEADEAENCVAGCKHANCCQIRENCSRHFRTKRMLRTGRAISWRRELGEEIIDQQKAETTG